MSDQELIDAANAPTYAFNENNWDKVRETLTKDFVYDEVCTNRVAEGVENVIELWKRWRAAFPDLHGSITNAFEGDGKVLKELTWRGTHTGPLPFPDADYPATGNSIFMRSCEVWVIAGGRGKSMVHYIDMMTLMQQLGLA
ncbi:MAG: ester cyclase [Thermodesulfobacteriota bacterium]